jgi:hypothetical protein
VIAIFVPILVIGLLVYLYYHKYGHYPFCGGKRATNARPRTNPAAPWSRTRAVWRPGDPEEGLPGYTMEAKEGELSLGMGRKRAVEEEELREALERSISEGSRGSEAGSTITTAAGNAEVTTPLPATTGGNPAEELPPYIPPPPPAVLLKNGYIFGRIGSRQSVGSASRSTS